jgi:protein TonB
VDFSHKPTFNTGLITSSARNINALPIVRVPPNYPKKAAAAGIEGWVQLSFSINPIGQVVDISVVDAEPKRLFDKEARRALKKWKYKPKVVDGEAVAQTNQSVVLEFTLDHTDS